MRLAMLAPLVTPIAEPQSGGTQALLSDLAAGLAARGHYVTVYAASGSVIPGVRVVDVGVDSSLLHAALFRANDPKASVMPALVEAFNALVDAAVVDDPEVVHNHAFDVPAWTAALRFGCPVVHTLHLPASVVHAEALREIRKARNVTLACVSEAQALGWRELVPIDLVLRNGVDTGRILFGAQPKHGALFAGRFSPEKGLAQAIEIARRAQVPLAVAGSAYDDDYADHVLAGSDVEMLGSLDRDDLYRRMSESSAVLCPAMWDEPFGLVAAEAAAAGTPVIAFARGGLKEIVTEATGWLGDDVDGAVHALQHVAEYDRTACREHAVRTLDLNLTLAGHEKLYETLRQD